jgi:hypothetical protein
MVTKRYENSTDFISILSWAFFITLAATISDIWLFLDTTDQTERMVFLTIGTVMWIVIFYFVGLKTFYLMRPKSVEVSDHGVKLNMRLGMKPVVIAWSDVRIIVLGTSVLGKDIGEISDDIAWYYPIDHHIAVELREAYRQQIGVYPPKTLDELCPGMQKDSLAMSSSEWNRKYERFKKKN